MARHHYETLQQVFDDAYRGLHAQGFVRSGYDRNRSFSCLYRGPGGTRCAVGHCIPDDLYQDWMEGYLASDLAVNAPQIFSASLSSVALEMLQSAHDMATSPDDMATRLSEFAKLFGLTIPSVEEAA